MFMEKRCHTCNALFYPCEGHIYKRSANHKGNRIILYFHTYSCMTTYDKAHPKAYKVKWGDKSQ